MIIFSYKILHLRQFACFPCKLQPLSAFPEPVHPITDVAGQKHSDGEEKPGGNLQHQSRLKDGISEQAGDEEFQRAGHMKDGSIYP